LVPYRKIKPRKKSKNAPEIVEEQVPSSEFDGLYDDFLERKDGSGDDDGFSKA
jgi:hypothetical protein